MRNMISILQKELKSYFYSPIAYVALTLFLLVTGFVFYLVFSEAARQSAMGTSFGAVDAPQWVLRNYFGLITTILLFIIPLITMGVYAEEKKKGTMELLFTSPLTNIQIIFGKFLANLVFCLILLLGSAVLLIPLFLAAAPPAGPILVGYLGIVLFAAALVGLGNFLSSLTENQIVSAILTFVLVLMLWFLSAFAQGGTGGVAEVLAYISPLQHLDDFQKGVISLSNVVYFFSLWTFGMYLTWRSLESLRWRG